MDTNCYANWPVILEYVRVFTSGPVMGFASTLALIWALRAPIVAFVNKYRPKELKVGPTGVVAVWPDQVITVEPPPLPVEQPGGIGQAAAAPNGGPEQGEPAAVNYQLPPDLANDPGAAQWMDWIRQNPGPGLARIMTLYNEYRCERLMNLIFRSQLLALQAMSLVPMLEWSVAQLKPHYDVHATAAASSQLTPKNFDDWIGFLIAMEAVEKAGEADAPTYKLVEFGQRFVTYQVAQYPHKADALSL